MRAIRRYNMVATGSFFGLPLMAVDDFLKAWVEERATQDFVPTWDVEQGRLVGLLDGEEYV